MKMKKSKIGIIGFGNMMDAIIDRTLLGRSVRKTQILVSQHRKDRDQQLQKKYDITFTSFENVCRNSQILFLGVKPQQMADILKQIQPHYQGQVIWTMAAGLELGFYKKYLGKNCKILRLMPNTPTRLGLGVTAFFASPNLSQTDKHIFTKALQSTGLVTEVTKEKDLHSLVALSASGPAFVFAFIQSLAAAGQKLGLPEALANQLANQTALGAATLLAESNLTVAEQIQRVASRKGTTEAGLKTLKEKKFSSIVLACLLSAKRRSQELARALK